MIALPGARNKRDRTDSSTLPSENNLGSGADVRKADTTNSPAEGALANRPVVLVVDDDPDTQTYMTAVLTRNYGVATAARAAEMWSKLDKHPHPVSLILMDLTLAGGEDGIELTRQLRAHARWGSIPVVALTAHASDEVRERALAAGCDDYISKPIDRRRLFALIESLIAHDSGKPDM